MQRSQSRLHVFYKSVSLCGSSIVNLFKLKTVLTEWCISVSVVDVVSLYFVDVVCFFFSLSFCLLVIMSVFLCFVFLWVMLPENKWFDLIWFERPSGGVFFPSRRHLVRSMYGLHSRWSSHSCKNRSQSSTSSLGCNPWTTIFFLTSLFIWQFPMNDSQGRSANFTVRCSYICQQRHCGSGGTACPVSDFNCCISARRDATSSSSDSTVTLTLTVENMSPIVALGQMLMSWCQADFWICTRWCHPLSLEVACIYRLLSYPISAMERREYQQQKRKS